ncbi:hypothetical protein, partial [Clostridium perfringens]|uniref:hypothetical protein n=1 Tax=Clostridium perfringens TaxID=1502 RepID=UPI002ACC0CE5
VVENGVNKGVSIYVLTILTEIAFFNAMYFFTKGVGVDEYFIILMNFLLLSPIILINMIYGNVNLRGKKLVIKGILFSIIPVVASYFIKDNYDVIGFLLIGIMLIIDTLVNSQIFKRGRYKGVKLFLISILIYIASIF